MLSCSIAACQHVPSTFKAACITPRLKKSDLDPTYLKHYRLIANLTVFSKLVERLLARQLVDYLNESRLLPDLQSAYRAKHSTETAVTKVLSDILLALDRGDLTMLTLLDLGFRFSRSRDITSSTRSIFRHSWISTDVVHVVPLRPHAVCPL